MKLSSDAQFFEQLGVDVIRVPERQQQWLLRDDPMTFLSWFDSPLGIQLLDIRRVILMNVKKSPELLDLLDTFGPLTVGQWIFSCEPQGLCNLTFGVQLPKAALTREVMEASLDHVTSHTAVGQEILQRIADDPSTFAGSVGAKVVETVSQDSKGGPSEDAEERWPMMMDQAYEALDSGRSQEAKKIFESLLVEGWVGARLALLDEFEGDYTAEEALKIAHEGVELAYPDYEVIGMHLKYIVIPRVMLNHLHSRHQEFRSADNPTEIMALAKELGAYLEKSRPEILFRWDDSRVTEVAVSFARICASFYSAWDLAGMPMRHHGRLLQALDFIYMNTKHLETRDWALDLIKQTILDWGEGTPATVLLDREALEVYERYR